MKLKLSDPHTMNQVIRDHSIDPDARIKAVGLDIMEPDFPHFAGVLVFGHGSDAERRAEEIMEAVNRPAVINKALHRGVVVHTLANEIAEDLVRRGMATHESGDAGASDLRSIIAVHLASEMMEPNEPPASALAKAYKTIRALVPESTIVSITTDCWWHGSGRTLEFNFRISILPAFDGTSCEGFDGKSLAEALHAFLAAEECSRIPSATIEDVEAVVADADINAQIYEAERTMDARTTTVPVNEKPDDDIPF